MSEEDAGSELRKMKNQLLRFDHVEVSYQAGPVVHDVSLRVSEGEILAVTGESGSGKSTILKAAAGLLGNRGLVTRGDIFFKDCNITNADPETLRRIRGAEIGMIFQDAGASFNPVRKIKNQLYEAVWAHERVSKAEIRKRALDLFDAMGISDGSRLLESCPFELSGGMNQRAGIMTAMILHPALLLADEPTSALDVCAQAKVLEELLRLREQLHTAIVIVTHSFGVAEHIADNIAVMYRGEIVEYGSRRQVTESPVHPYTKSLLESVPHLKSP